MAEETHPKEWLELSFRIDPIAQEALGAFLFDLGCTGIVSEDFQDPALRAYFPGGCDPEDIASKTDIFLEGLLEVFQEMADPVWTWRKMPAENWSQAWRRFFHPTRITPSLLILPAWETGAEAGQRVIRIDPGPAFGTGQHPTTQMCLRALETVTPDQTWSMMDLGTGSGLLAIYGALLGAGRILALDVDPDALAWASRNLELNGVRARVELSAQPVETCSERFSVVAANLVLGEILRLMPCFQRILDPTGHLVLSGLLDSQLAVVEQVLPANGLYVEKTFLQGEWGCLICGIVAA